MKNIFLLLFCCCTLFTAAQDQPPFDGKKWEAPYTLPVPAGWEVERFPVPISFAPSIPYKGVEDLRFTPGWAKKESNEYWSYAFLWYLDGKQTFDAGILKSHLEAYYAGLFHINTDPNTIDSIRLVQVKATINPAQTAQGDLLTFSGSVLMNDYMTKLPITLNLTAHIRHCEGQDKTFVFLQLSPKPVDDPVWKGLNDLWLGFTCTK